MPRTYADLLKEARAQIREVTPAEVEADYYQNNPRTRPGSG